MAEFIHFCNKNYGAIL